MNNYLHSSLNPCLVVFMIMQGDVYVLACILLHTESVCNDSESISSV